MSSANAPLLLPETPVPLWLPRLSQMQNVYQEIFVAVENGCVREA